MHLRPATVTYFARKQPVPRRPPRTYYHVRRTVEREIEPCTRDAADVETTASRQPAKFALFNSSSRVTLENGWAPAHTQMEDRDAPENQMAPVRVFFSVPRIQVPSQAPSRLPRSPLSPWIKGKKEEGPLAASLAIAGRHSSHSPLPEQAQRAARAERS